MKKINSIGYGSKIVLAIFIFLFLIPLLLYLLTLSFGYNLYMINMAKISVFIGILVLTFLIILLTIELKQDKHLNLIYQNNRESKIEVSDDCYECQNCGCQKLKQHDQTCPVCGVTFKK